MLHPVGDNGSNFLFIYDEITFYPSTTLLFLQPTKLLFSVSINIFTETELFSN